MTQLNILSICHVEKHFYVLSVQNILKYFNRHRFLQITKEYLADKYIFHTGISNMI